MNNKRLAGQLQALADDTRLRILALVSDGSPSATELNQALLMSQPRVAHHLKVLVDAGFLESRRDGRYVRYTFPGSGFEQKLAALVLQVLRKPDVAMIEDLQVLTTRPHESGAVRNEVRPREALAGAATPAAESPEGNDGDQDGRREMEDFLL